MGKSEHHNVGEASNVNHLSTISWIFTFYSLITSAKWFIHLLLVNSTQHLHHQYWIMQLLYTYQDGLLE